MPFGRNNHGGRRSNSGRKRVSETLGPRDRFGGLHRFFFGTPTQNVEETPNNDPTDTATVAVTNELTDAQVANVENRVLPNYDAQDDMFDEELSKRGKTITDSENLSFQRKAIMEKSFYQNVYSNISNAGVLWHLPPSYIQRPKFSMKERWKDFFQLRVFNWIPEAMIGDSWVPSCPNCDKPLTKNGRGCLPRIVFDQTENYWLNAPNKYTCFPCKDTFDDSQDTNENEKYSFRSTSELILKQIGASHPEILDLFPCHLTKKMPSTNI